jgi:hypothetical protein
VSVRSGCKTEPNSSVGPERNVGDLRIGLSGTGSLTINDGGLVLNESGNWDWVGQEQNSNGTLTIQFGWSVPHNRRGQSECLAPAIISPPTPLEGRD